MTDDEKLLTFILIKKYFPLVLALGLIATGAISSINKYLGLKKNSFLEKELHELIEETIGVSYDFTNDDDN